jgi:hypothetical protein
MEIQKLNSRRKFINSLTTGAMIAGLSLIPDPIQAKINSNAYDFKLNDLSSGGPDLDKELKKLGTKAHPVAYDISQANPWGLIWSNVYYLTNGETGTPGDQLGVLNVFRHHGMIFGLNDATISKYKLGEFFGLNDPITNAPTVRNPYYDPEDGVFPLPGLAGIKALQEMGTVFCICDMARKVYAQFVAQKVGAKTEDVYNDFVAGTLPGVKPAPSGVWVLGRLAENKIAYIDASVG